MPHPLSTGIKTEGIGKVTTSHLNLTKTMEAEVAAEVDRLARVSTQTAAKRAVYLNRFSTKRARGIR